MGARYCSECGAPLRPEHSPLSDPVKVTFGTGEFKPTTILFADIVASTELVSDLDPEEAMHRLAPAVALMRRAVERSGGTIMHMLGDGIMAVFGAPRAQEGHALMACRAALAIQSEFPTRAGGPSVRVGLHSGTIVSETNLPGMINEREAYGVAIHIASRMQSLADPGKILLSEDCYQLVRRFCTARSPWDRTRAPRPARSAGTPTPGPPGAP
ncbi:adenylate/guanylate cyclase domain-containing protein, partial [Streptomyces albidoflavus]|uniref:adenylate/guanylate cyclase domain-containing protein n=1 Tax=Streptomyces albidoflavus TaxID=1886 RepID=UPI00342EAA7C